MKDTNSLYKTRFMALQGSILSVKVTTQKESIRKVLWLHDIYPKYMYLKKEDNNLEWDSISDKTFMNLSLKMHRNKEFYYVFFRNTSSTHLSISVFNNKGFTSWEKASDLCRSIEGYLPYFTSREDLDELLALFKMSLEIPPIEAIYIGLKFVNKIRV